MQFKRLMLTLLSYPEPTPVGAIEAADTLAVHLDAELCAALSIVTIPDVSNMLARRLTGAAAAIAEENRQSAANADALAARFASITGSADPHRLGRLQCFNIINPDLVAQHARLFDLAILPIYDHPDERFLIEGLLFDSGRPLLVIPQRIDQRWDHVLIGWDGSRAAARALADALPLCERAKSVEVITISGDKPLPHDLLLAEVRRLLACHQIEAASSTVALEHEDAGGELLAQAQRRGVDLLVMGGFGHSRMREFFLGGATRTVLHRPPLPVFLST